MTRRRERLVEGLPEPERAIANGDLRRDRQAARLQIDEQLLPALPALPHARLKADQLLLALRRRPHQHQHAFGLRLHARLQIDAVRPDVDVMARRQIALLPSPIFVLPFALEAPTRKGWARPCRARRRAPPGNRRRKSRADRERVEGRRGSWCGAPIWAGCST